MMSFNDRLTRPKRKGSKPTNTTTMGEQKKRQYLGFNDVRVPYHVDEKMWAPIRRQSPNRVSIVNNGTTKGIGT